MIKTGLMRLVMVLSVGVLGGEALAEGRTAEPSPERVAYACDGRHLCGQMRSCEEAYYFLEVCGVHRLDGDNDGVPCEKLCGQH